MISYRNGLLEAIGMNIKNGELIEIKQEEKIEIKKDIVQEIEEKQFKKCGHDMRFQDDKLIKRIVKWNPTGTSERCRCNVTQNEGVRSSTEKEI
jgi:hypothetical protein